MRFDPIGPDLPPELIAAQEQGEVVFVCGAGVSMTVGLPSFRQLVTYIYAELSDSWAAHVAEADAMDSGAYDRVIRCLERRLGGDDPKLVQRIRERIRNAVRKGLAPPTESFQAHSDITTLSRDAEMDNRLVTTNFDTLFERAWVQNNGATNRARSHAGASMPGPLAAGFSGILHLHGRIRDTDLNLDESDLVLTSAEFGEAYLRSGWAARYVYDLVRATTVVIIGYTADDPPMRYLLEVIDADRERFKDLRAVYAFVPFMPGDEERQYALWKSKGVVPVSYETTTDADHSKLYTSVGLWARYAEDPTLWRRNRMAQLLARPPNEASNEQLEEVKWLLNHADAASNLGSANPSPDWMQKFSELGSLNDKANLLWPWVIQNLSNAEMIQACADCAAIDTRFFSSLGFELSRRSDKVGNLMVAVWHVLIRARTTGPTNRAWMNSVFESKRRLQLGDAGYGTVQLLAEALRPRASARRPFRFGEQTKSKLPPTSIGDILTIDFNSEIERAGIPEIAALLAAVPRDKDTEFDILEKLSWTLLDSLDDATDSGFVAPGYDRASHQVPSVAEHQQNEYSTGFYPLVRVIADLWDRAAPRDTERGKRFAKWCYDQKYTLFKRLALHFLSNRAVYDGAEAGVLLAGLPDPIFWTQARREQMRLMAERWNDFPQEVRNALEERLIAGPPDALYGGE